MLHLFSQLTDLPVFKRVDPPVSSDSVWRTVSLSTILAVGLSIASYAPMAKRFVYLDPCLSVDELVLQILM